MTSPPGVKTTEAMKALLPDFLACVHCGLCLENCPTYALLGQEMDSPRGRMYLMRAVAEGKANSTPSIALHLDACLGCRACETACPSGVRYGRVLEVAREHTGGSAGRASLGRVFAWLMSRHLAPYPRRLKSALYPVRLLERAGLRRGLELLSDGPGILAPIVRAWEMLPPARREAVRLPDSLPAMGEPRGKVALWLCCVTGVVMPQVVQASAMVLSRAGFDVIFPKGQVCCGALALHDGDGEGARRLARKNVALFSSLKVDAIVTDSAGCGAMMKEYGSLLADAPVFSGPAKRFSSRVRDISEFLAEVDMPQPQNELDARVTYHDACHLVHGQGISEQPRALLKTLPGIDMVEMNESDWCCGGAGAYNLRQPRLSRWLAERKVANILATGAEIVAAANPGCQLQIAAALRRAGRPLPVVHPVELVANAHGLLAPLGRASR